MCDEDGLPRREEEDLEALEEDREGASFSSSSAKLRSFEAWFWGFLGLAAAVEPEGFDKALTAVVEGASSSSLSSSSARRRKFLALLPIVAVSSDWFGFSERSGKRERKFEFGLGHE